MKKLLLNRLFLVIVTAVICITGTATAAYIYTARDIGYTPSDENWNVSNVQDAINEIKTDVNNINDLVDQGDMLYLVGTSVVGLVSDDTPYKDSNDKYILADSTSGKNMIDNVTYKAISSTETLKGKVGSDSVEAFNARVSPTIGDYGQYKTSVDYPVDLTKNIVIVITDTYGSDGNRERTDVYTVENSILTHTYDGSYSAPNVSVITDTSKVRVNAPNQGLNVTIISY